MIRLSHVATLSAFTVVAFAARPATADTKMEMAAIVDKIAQSKPDAESVIDWDNLTVKSSQLKNMDVHKMYTGMDAANKKAFRESFLKSFASSFQQSSHGHSFTEAAKIKGGMEVKEKG